MNKRERIINAFMEAEGDIIKAVHILGTPYRILLQQIQDMSLTTEIQMIREAQKATKGEKG